MPRWLRCTGPHAVGALLRGPAGGAHQPADLGGRGHKACARDAAVAKTSHPHEESLRHIDLDRKGTGLIRLGLAAYKARAATSSLLES